MIYSGVCLLLFYFIVPETFPPVLLQWKARELRKTDPVGNKDVYAEHERGDWSLKGVVCRTLIRPVEMVLQEKILVFVTIYLSFVYGIMYSRECPWTSSILGLTGSRSVVFEALPIVFSARRGFSVEQLGLIYIGVFRAFAGRSDLTPIHSCFCRRSPRGCDLRLALKEHERARGEMGGFPTSRGTTTWCYSCRPTPGDRLLLARLDRRIQLYPLVFSDALDHSNWLRGQLDVLFTNGELRAVLLRGTGVYAISRAT